MKELSPQSASNIEALRLQLHQALAVPIPIAVHRQLHLSTEKYLEILAAAEINRALFDQHPDIPGYPHSLIRLSPWLDQLTPTEIDQALLEFECTSGEGMAGNDWRHEVAHYRKARELGFLNPEFFVYAFFDKSGNTALQWFMITGPVPDRMTDDEVRLALYQISLAPADPSPTDRRLAKGIRKYYRTIPDQTICRFLCK